MSRPFKIFLRLLNEHIRGLLPTRSNEMTVYRAKIQIGTRMTQNLECSITYRGLPNDRVPNELR